MPGQPITILISVDYIGEGDYYKGEFYVLLLTSAFVATLVKWRFPLPLTT